MSNFFNNIHKISDKPIKKSFKQKLERIGKTIRTFRQTLGKKPMEELKIKEILFLYTHLNVKPEDLLKELKKTEQRVGYKFFEKLEINPQEDIDAEDLLHKYLGRITKKYHIDLAKDQN